MKDSCQTIAPLIAAYSLHALDHDDAVMVEKHLPGCEDCQSELLQYQALERELLLATPPTSPPKRLRKKTANAAFGRVDGRRKPMLSGWRVKRLTGIAYAAGMVALVALNLFQLVRSQQLAATERDLIEQNETYERALAMLTSPEAVLIAIGDSGVRGTLVYASSGKQAVLNLWGLMPINDEQSYQIWLIRPDQTRVSGGVFQINGPNEEIVIEINSPDMLSSYSGLGITLEPAGGSPEPTGPRVIGIDL